jgi:hypothetical protein
VAEYRKGENHEISKKGNEVLCRQRNGFGIAIDSTYIRIRRLERLQPSPQPLAVRWQHASHLYGLYNASDPKAV